MNKKFNELPGERLILLCQVMMYKLMTKIASNIIIMVKMLNMYLLFKFNKLFI